MKTMTTVEAVEKLDSGAYRMKFPGDVIAGTLNAEIGDLAVRLAGEENANPVEIQVEEIGNGRLEVVKMTEITEPDLSEDVAKAEAVAPGSDPTGDAAQAAVAEEEGRTEPTLDSVIMNGLVAFSDEALLAEVARRLATP